MVTKIFERFVQEVNSQDVYWPLISSDMILWPSVTPSHYNISLFLCQ